MSDWRLGAGPYRSPVKHDMAAADPAAVHSQSGLSGQKLHLSSVISLRKLKDSKNHSCYWYCYRYCHSVLSNLAWRDFHVKQGISSRLTQLGSDSETFCIFLLIGVMVSIIHVLDTVMSVRNIYHRWETIKAIFIAAYDCN